MTAGGKYHVPFDFLDINMGCPAPKITGSGAGSALLKDPQLAGQVAQAVVKTRGVSGHRQAAHRLGHGHADRRGSSQTL